MYLSDSIRQYYIDHLDELPADKKFHFASRLAAWNSDPSCSTILDDMRSDLVGKGDSIKQDLYTLLHNPPTAKINAAEARAPYFAQYPSLRGRMLALFRVRHLLFIYGVDARDDLLSIVPYTDLHTLALTLANDSDALRSLSTYAINYLYLLEYILYPRNSSSIDVDALYRLADVYDTSQPEQILLLIYLYTHCIIGDSNFYQRPVDSSRREVYLRMLARIESLMQANFEGINLDNKLEFLVCCQICDFKTELQDRIFEECAKSLSPDGTFLIDTLNSYQQSNKRSFADSEHRNVLFIMSTTPFKPRT